MVQSIGFGATFKIGGVPTQIAKRVSDAGEGIKGISHEVVKGAVQAGEEINKIGADKKTYDFLKVNNMYILKDGTNGVSNPAKSDDFKNADSTYKWIIKQYTKGLGG